MISGALFDAYSTTVNGVRTTNYVPMQMMGGAFMAMAGLVAVLHVFLLERDLKVKEEVGGKWKPV